MELLWHPGMAAGKLDETKGCVSMDRESNFDPADDTVEIGERPIMVSMGTSQLHARIACSASSWSKAPHHGAA
jgi:hypothetical protein